MEETAASPDGTYRLTDTGPAEPAALVGRWAGTTSAKRLANYQAFSGRRVAAPLATGRDDAEVTHRYGFQRFC